MKKTVLFIALMLSLSMAMLCFAGEPAAADATAEEMLEAAASEAPAGYSASHPAVGFWRMKGMEGVNITLPQNQYFVYPDGTIADYKNNLFGFTVALSEDGSFTVDTSGMEEFADYTVTGKAMPISQDSLEQFGVDTDDSTLDFSENAQQLILTISFPDPANPLASSPAVTTAYFLRTTAQYDLLKNYLSGKTWKIGENTLTIDAEGNLDLNNASSTGKLATNSLGIDSPRYFPVTVEMRWDKGGNIKYAPILITADKIELENLDKPEETILLELADSVEAEEAAEAELSEDAAAEAEISEDAQAAEAVESSEAGAAENPFLGKWEVVSVTENGEEIPAKELLQADTMTAEVKEDGVLTLVFDQNYTVSLHPVYDANTLTVTYKETGYDMNWTAIWYDDTVTAAFDVYNITLQPVQ